MSYRHEHDDTDEEFPWLVLDGDEPVESFRTEADAIDWKDNTISIVHRPRHRQAGETQ